MDWIINGLAFVGALALAAIAIFLWACWHDVTSQPTRPRQTKPRSASGRHSSRSTSGASSGRHPHSGGAGTTAAPHSTGRTGWLASRRTARAIRRQQRQAWDRAMGGTAAYLQRIGSLLRRPGHGRGGGPGTWSRWSRGAAVMRFWRCIRLPTSRPCHSRRLALLLLIKQQPVWRRQIRGVAVWICQFPSDASAIMNRLGCPVGRGWGMDLLACQGRMWDNLSWRWRRKKAFRSRLDASRRNPASAPQTTVREHRPGVWPQHRSINNQRRRRYVQQ